MPTQGVSDGALSFCVINTVMHIKDITEAPLTQRQEKQLMSKVGRHQEITGSWPDAGSMISMIQEIEPRARSIGAGMFGEVFGKPQGRTVVKLAGDSFTALQYIKWCTENQNNPHVPRIYSLFTPERHGYRRVSRFYIRMERLVELVPYKYKWGKQHLPFLSLLRKIEGGGLDTALFAAAFGFDNPEDYNREELQDLFSKKKDYQDFIAQMAMLWKTDPLCQPLREAQNIGGVVDLYLTWDEAENMMLRRSTNQIVITDPVAA